MKKFYFLVSGLLLSMGAMAQVQNGGFENWTNAEPDGWSTQDGFIGLAPSQNISVQIGGNDITESATESTSDPLEGSSSARVQSFTISGSPIPQDLPDGVYANSLQQDVVTTTKYSGVAFAYKSDIQGTDAVGVFINATKNGQVVAQGYKVYTNTEAAWVRDTVNLSYSAEPDTIEILFASSFGTMIGAPGAPATGIDGTIMEVDDVQFLVAPNYADGASNITATDIGDNADGRDLQVRFDAAADESTVSEYRIFVLDEGLGLADWSGAPPVAYEVVTPNGNPDYTYVYSQSSMYLADQGGGSVAPEAIENNIPMQVYVLAVADGTYANEDQIAGPSNSITLGTVGLSTETVQSAIVYPNPTQNQVNVMTGFDKGSVAINSITGQEVANGTILNGSSKIDVSNLKNGIYIYTIRNQEGAIVKTSKLVIQ